MQTPNNKLPGNTSKSADPIMQQANLQLLPLIMNNVPQALSWKGRDFVYLGCNQAFAKRAGFSSPEEVIGKTDFDMPWKDQAELYHADDRKILERGEARLNFEERQTASDGSVIWFRASKVPVHESGEIVAILGIHEDITERKHAEEATRINEEKLRAIYEGTNDAVMLLNEQGFFDCNQRTLEMFGFKNKEEFTTIRPSDVSPDIQLDGRDSLSSSQEHIQTAYQKGYDRFEWVHRRMNGEDFPAEVLLSALDFSGQIVLQATVRDITERKLVEQRLNESEERYHRLAEASVEGVVIHDKGILLDANEVFAIMFGYELSEVIGMMAGEFLTPETREITAQNIRSGYEKPYEVMGLRKDGSTFPVEITGKSIPYQGRTVRVTALRDITERKRLEQEIQTAFERRGRQVQISTQVSQAIGTAASLDDLYQRVVTEVKEQFGYYHTQLLRYDAMQDVVVLVRGYGEIGEKMLATGHHLPMGKGLIGTAADTGDTMLRPTLENDPNWQPHPLLPDTKGEIAVPIKLGDKILGVLDVQSDVAGTLAADDQLLLEGLCGQIAIAIESTRLSQEMAERLKEINRLYRAMSREGWQTYWQTTDVPLGYMYDQGGLREVKETALAEELFVNIPLAVPGGEVIGNLAIMDDLQRPLSSEDKDFVQQVSEQIALALESARLFEQTQSALASTQDSESRLSEALNIAKEALDIARLAHWEYDFEKDLFTFNDQFYSIFRTNAEQVGGYQLSSARYTELFVLPEDAAVVGNEIGKALSSTERHFATKLEHRVIFADGNMGYISVEVHVERDENGKIIRWYGANQDITERRTAQEMIAKRARDLAAVSEISSASTRELDIEKLLETVVHLTQRKFGLYHAHVFLYNEKADDLEIAACGWKEGDEHEGTHGTTSIPLAQEQSLVARAARTQKAVIANDVRNESGWLPNPLLPDTAAELAVPLLIGDRVLGVLDVQADHVNAFTEEDANIQTTLASQVATALQNARSFNQAQKQAERETMLNIINQKIQSATSVEAVLQIAARELGHALGAPMTIAQISMKDKSS